MQRLSLFRNASRCRSHHEALFLSVAFVTGMCLTLWSTEVKAADTTETFDIGATDVEFAVGFDGIGKPETERSISNEMLLGYGLTERFSTYMGASISANDRFVLESTGLNLGVFGTPIDTDHFDMDLQLEFGVDDSFCMTPGFELNFDLEPDLAKWGLYANVQFPIYARTVGEGQNEEYRRTVDISPTFGTYYTVVPGHQLLLEFDMNAKTKTYDGEDSVEIGGLALGYNVEVIDSIELVNHLYFDVPQNDEKFGVGIQIGFVGTLPSFAK